VRRTSLAAYSAMVSHVARTIRWDVVRRAPAVRLKHFAQHGFTLIELMVVLTILALLLTVAVPKYFSHVDRAKEATLRQDLQVMRDAIDKFYADKGRYPEQLDELVSARYIRNIPVDPISESISTWRVIAPPESETQGAVYDIKSGAEGTAQDGSQYADW
jgi:general secretion pathway protein G